MRDFVETAWLSPCHAAFKGLRVSIAAAVLGLGSVSGVCGETPLRNAQAVFSAGEGHVAFLGGSITQMDGYRPMVMDYLKGRFPRTRFTFTNAGLSSTCSTSGAFRLKEHVLDHGPVDLLFVEFAVNDDQDAAHAERACVRGMEGVIRRLRVTNSRADVVMIYFVNPFILGEFQAGRTPLTIAAHARVAEHYGVTVIPLAQQVAADIAAGRYDWDRFGGVHPAPFGNRVCADLIEAACDQAWAAPPLARPTDHTLPPPLDNNAYFHGAFLKPEALQPGEGWSWSEPSWERIEGKLRKDYANRKLLHTETSGAELNGSFSGTALGAFMLAGPDSGMAESSIDQGPYTEVKTRHHFSKNLHYPRTLMFATDLEPGPHTFRLRLQGEGALRILHLVANQPPLPRKREPQDEMGGGQP